MSRIVILNRGGLSRRPRNTTPNFIKFVSRKRVGIKVKVTILKRILKPQNCERARWVLPALLGMILPRGFK